LPGKIIPPAGGDKPGRLRCAMIWGDHVIAVEIARAAEKSFFALVMMRGR